MRFLVQIGDLTRLVRLLNTPIRRLEAIAYWVIEDPEAIHDFINTEVKKEWEADAKSEGRDPREDSWLKALSKYKWRLLIVRTDLVKLDADIMNYVNSKTGYNFAERLTKRSEQLQREIKEFGQVIWPVIVREENMQLVDGYCRYTAVKAMSVSRIYAYVGAMFTR
jgi:hypothetical protein